ncbi:MAG: hypothetical protein KF797_12770 [Flavobacteriales bacterium]|nr:hypothetical protein [Flavobacteriales bacterium]
MEKSFAEIIGEMEDKLRSQARDYLENELPKQKAFENEHAATLAKHGWYLSSRMLIGEFWGVLAKVRDGQFQEAEEVLLAHYRDQLSGIRQDLLDKYADRTRIISESFDAHTQGMFFASTILFLSLADGVCNGQLMTKERHHYLGTQKSRVITKAVLGVKSAIDVHHTQKLKYFSDLNRHEVMHGLSFSYGTEINSLKALSLLAFASNFIGDLNNWDLYGIGPEL